MTRIAHISFILMICISCKSSFQVTERPTDYSIGIKNSRFKGMIFLENANCFLCFQDKERFSPTLLEIENAESILNARIKNINNPLVNQGNNCPIIHQNLNHYKRQYFGYEDKVGDRIIYAIFSWDRYNFIDILKGNFKDESENWKKDIQHVSDGCSYYWEVKINLDKKELFDLKINGGA